MFTRDESNVSLNEPEALFDLFLVDGDLLWVPILSNQDKI
jgi:hypothetical protein